MDKDPSVNGAKVPCTSEGGLQYLTTLYCEHAAWVEAGLLRACGVPADCLRGFGPFNGKLCEHTIAPAYLNDWVIPHEFNPLVGEVNFFARFRYTGKATESNGMPLPAMDRKGEGGRFGGLYIDSLNNGGEYKVLSSRIEPPK